MLKLAGAILVLLMDLFTGPSQIFAQPIDDAVVKSVVQILTPPRANRRGDIGTGFLITVPLEAANEQGLASFLVTNKHMLGEWNPIDGDFDHNDWIMVRLYRDMLIPEGPVEEVQVQLKMPDGKLDLSRLALHPEKTVDVAVVRIDDVVMKHQKQIRKRLKFRSLTKDWLEPFAELPGPYGYIGAPVFALGYPRGITSLLTNYPIAKRGHLAATAGEEIALDTSWTLRNGQQSGIVVRGKLFLIDGLIVSGNSGGPIVFPGAGAIGKDPKTEQLTIKARGSSKVLGIVSGGFGSSGLSYAYATDYFRSLIDDLLVRGRNFKNTNR